MENIVTKIPINGGAHTWNNDNILHNYIPIQNKIRCNNINVPTMHQIGQKTQEISI